MTDDSSDNIHDVYRFDQSPGGQTPLHGASKNGHLPVVEFLVASGARVNAQDRNGVTALGLACLNGHLGVVKFLVQHGAFVKHRAKYAATPLHMASARGSLPLVQLLVQQQQGALVDARDANGMTPLTLASFLNEHVLVVQFLVEHGATLTHRADNGATPLHMACSRGHLSTVQYLIRQGADETEEDANGNLPIHLAMGRHHETARRQVAVVNYLQEREQVKRRHSLVLYLVQQGFWNKHKEHDGE